MGARGNIVVKDDFSDGEVFLYFHWSGHNIEKIVKEALSLKQRWDDSQYLTNIIYSVAYESSNGVSGISSTLGDNEFPMLVLDCKEQTITEETEKREILNSWTFQGFLEK